METFKLDDSQPSVVMRNCGNCLHRYEERMPGQLMPSLVCHRFPPQVVLVPAPAPTSKIQTSRQPQPVGMQMMSMFPVVQMNTFCHCHDSRPIGDMPVPVTDPDVKATTD